MNRCSTERHARLKADPELWAHLPHAGRQYVPADQDGPEFTAELRNCPCGSTLCLVVPTTDADRATVAP